MTNPPETLDIEAAIARWEEIIGRTEVGEIFVNSVGGVPKARLEPLLSDDSPRQGGQWRGQVRIADDFDMPPDEVAVTFGIGPKKQLE